MVQKLERKRRSAGFVKKVKNKVKKSSSHSEMRREPDTMDASRNSLPGLMLDTSSENQQKKKRSSSSRLKDLVTKGKKNKDKKKKKKNVTSLYAALDMVTPKYVLQKLDQVRQDASVVLLNIEDLIGSGNEQSEELLVQFSQFFFVGDRKWESINFADNVSHGTFKGWISSMRGAMDFFEDLFRENSSNTDNLGFEALTFQAKIELDENSPISIMAALLRNIKRQRRVANVKFLMDTCEADRGMLHGLMKNEDGQLNEAVMVVVTFGWMPDPEGLVLLEAFLRMARDTGETSSIDSELPGLRRSSTDPTPDLLPAQQAPLRRNTSDIKSRKNPQAPLRGTGLNASWFDEPPKDGILPATSQRQRQREKRPSARIPRLSTRTPNVDTNRMRSRRKTLTPPRGNNRQSRIGRHSAVETKQLQRALSAEPNAGAHGASKRLSRTTKLVVNPKKANNRFNPYESCESDNDSNASSLHSSDLSESERTFGAKSDVSLGDSSKETNSSGPDESESGLGKLIVTEGREQVRKSLAGYVLKEDVASEKKTSDLGTFKTSKTVRSVKEIDLSEWKPPTQKGAMKSGHSRTRNSLGELDLRGSVKSGRKSAVKTRRSGLTKSASASDLFKTPSRAASRPESSIDGSTNKSFRRQRKIVRVQSSDSTTGGGLKSSSSAPSLFDEVAVVKSFQKRRRKSSKDLTSFFSSKPGKTKFGSSKSCGGQSDLSARSGRSIKSAASTGKNVSFPRNESRSKKRQSQSNQRNSDTKVTRKASKARSLMNAVGGAEAHGKAKASTKGAEVIQNKQVLANHPDSSDTLPHEKVHGLTKSHSESMLGLMDDSDSEESLESRISQIWGGSINNKKEGDEYTETVPASMPASLSDGLSQLKMGTTNSEGSPTGKTMADYLPSDALSLSGRSEHSSSSLTAEANGTVPVKRRSLRVRRALSSSNKGQNMGGLLGKLNAVELDVSL